jgi:hypothetical protein
MHNGLGDAKRTRGMIREEIVLLPVCTLQPVCKIRALCAGRSNTYGERNLIQDPISVAEDKSYAHRRFKGRDLMLSLTNNHSFIAMVWKPAGTVCIASKVIVGKTWRSHLSRRGLAR